MKKFWIVFVIVAVVVGGGFGALWYGLSQLEQGVSIDGGVLVWDVSGSFPEERDETFMGQMRGGGELTLRETLFALYRAAEDERITGLVMNMYGLKADWAKIEEMREAIDAFKDSGKPVYAYLDGAGTREYALAVAADKVAMSPEANLMVLGMAIELSFMKDTLEKLGMEADFVHVGKYKSAPERMTRSSASDANRQMINAIVDDRYESLKDMLADSRDIDSATVGRWIDRGMFDSADAMAEGLVDTTLYYEQLMDWQFEEDQETTDLADYALSGSNGKEADHTVAIVYVSGVIMPGESRFSNFQGKIAGSTTIVEQIQSVKEDEDIDAVILRVDSPGGSALASDLVWHELQELKKEKHLVVSMSGLAASGGYYVACLGDSIFADAGTITGSIGVYAGKMSRAQMYEKIGVNREFITRGENALLFNDAGTFSDKQRDLFQGQLDSFYERFLAKVGEGRGLTRDEVHEVAQGRVWTGRQGLDIGLVDAPGGLRRSLTSTKWMMGLDQETKVNVVSFGEELSLFERILLQSLRDVKMARFTAPLADLYASGVLPAGSTELVGPVLWEHLRNDGTFAGMALLDGRPVAMMPFWLKDR